MRDHSRKWPTLLPLLFLYAKVVSLTHQERRGAFCGIIYYMTAIFISLAKFILVLFLLGIAVLLLLPLIIILILKFTGSSRHVTFKVWRGFTPGPSPGPEKTVESDTSITESKIIDAEWSEPQ